MPGVLVDEQAFYLDPPSHGFPIDSFSTPVSCANPYTYIHAPVSQLQARSSYYQLAPSFSRTISVDSKDRERSHILSQISLLHNRSQSHASVAVPDALGFTANANGEPVKRGGMTTWVGGLGAEDPVAKIGSSEMGGHTSGAFVAPSLDASLFKNSQGMYCNGQEFEEPRVGSPYSSGTSLWAQSNGGSLVGSPTLPDAILALRKFLPSNLEDDEAWPAVDVFSCDEFRMFEFKVRLCMRGRSHDWTECPFAHPGEKARRRDPRRFHYSGTACPDFRKGNCKRGDACEYAHGVFECWLHPARYRTQPCKDGRNCKRRVCFFAHTSEQLRLLPAAAQAATRTGSHPSSPRSSFAQKLAQCVSYDGSPMRSGMGASADAMQTIDTGFEGQSTDRLYSCCNGANTGGYQLGCSLHGPPHNGLCSVASQLSSPTSTLRGYSLSSPPLSPPLSPPTSPPLSPGAPADWSSYVSCVAAATTHTHPLSQVSGMSQAGVLQLQVPTGTSIHSVPSQAGISVHRRHLDRLNSIPALPIRSPLRGPSQPESSLPSSPQSLPTCSTLASKQISDLIATLKHLEFAGAEPFWLPTQALQAGQSTARCPSGPSPLRHSSQSVPSTPRMFVGKEADSDFWGVDAIDAEVSLERVESGRGLRAKIFENLVKGSQQDSLDEQDVGWVNDLVKEESDHK